MTSEQIEVLKECQAALAGVLEDEALSVERALQVSQAEARSRAVLGNSIDTSAHSNVVKDNWIKRLWRWLSEPATKIDPWDTPLHKRTGKSWLSEDN